MADPHNAAPLAGKVALVVGATGDLGSKFALGLADAGADVVLSSRTRAALELLAESIRSKTGRRAAVAPADLESRADVEMLADVAWNAFGHIDVVLVSARPRGHTTTHGGTVLTTPDDAWEWFQNVIVLNPLRLLRNLAAKMIERGEPASIITVISEAGLHAIPGLDAYGLAKGGLTLLTRYMALEWGPHNIRVNAINPNGVVMADDAETRAYVERKTQEYGFSNALDRLGTAEEIVGSAIFLASDHSSYMTGQLLTHDGGRWL